MHECILRIIIIIIIIFSLVSETSTYYYCTLYIIHSSSVVFIVVLHSSRCCRPFLTHTYTHTHTLIMNFQKNKLSVHCSFHYPIHMASPASSYRMQNKVLGRIILFSFVVLILCLLACNVQKRERETVSSSSSWAEDKKEIEFCPKIYSFVVSFVVH